MGQRRKVSKLSTLQAKNQEKLTSVTSTLNVEDSGVGPNVFVISNKLTGRVGGKSGLSSSGKSEEEGNISLLSLVSGGVEGKLSELDGLQVVLKDRINVSTMAKG